MVLVVLDSSLANLALPAIAAVLLSVASWRWFFAVNIPLGIPAMVIGWSSLPLTRGTARPFDRPSAILNTLTFAALFLVVSAIAHGEVGAVTALIGAVGMLFFLLLYRRSRATDAPMVPLDLIAVPVLRLSYATSICAFGAQMIGLVCLPFLLPGRLHYSHAETGLLITCLPVGVPLAAPLSGRLIERMPAGLLGAIGLAIVSLAYALCDVGTPTLLLGAGIAACGFGFGIFQAPNNRTMIGSGPKERAGAAAGMQAVARLLGQTLGAVAVALLFRLNGTWSTAPLVAAAGLGALSAALSASRLRH